MVQLHRGTSWISKAIKFQSRSEYSHASVLLPGGDMIESKEGIGVRILHPGDAEHTRYQSEAFRGKIDQFDVLVTNACAARAEQFWRDQEGADYDYRGVLRFLIRRKAALDKNWFCSELVFDGFRAGGLALLSRTAGWEVAPGMLARSTRLIGPK